MMGTTALHIVYYITTLNDTGPGEIYHDGVARPHCAVEYAAKSEIPAFMTGQSHLHVVFRPEN